MLKEKKRGEISVKRGKEKRAGQAEMKKMHGGGKKNSFLLSVSLCISLTQQSGSASSSSPSYKRTVTHSSALHSLATEGR